MNETGIYIVLIFVLIFLNAIFVLSEMSVVSSRKARLQQRANEGDKLAGIALKLAEHPAAFLSTVQIGITLIGILLGAFGEDALRVTLSAWFDDVPLLAPYAEALGFFVGVVVITTTLSIVFGELVPKRIALQNPERIAAFIAVPMIFLSRLFYPLVWFFDKATGLILRIMGIKLTAEHPVTEEEILVQIDQGMQAGVIEETEQDMVEGVFRMHERRVFSLMTPRSEIVWLDVKDDAVAIQKVIEESAYSRFPVCEDSLDNVLGIIKARDLLLESLHGQPLALKRNLQPVTYIPETAQASRALDIFKVGTAEILLVVDEFGSVQGLLTINDILAEIVGDIEVGEPQATQRQDGSWLLDGMLTVEDFKEIFNVRYLPEEDEYETLSGFMMIQLGRVPHTSDNFEWNNFRFEVMDMDGNRVDKVLVTTIPAKPPVT